MDKDKYYIPTIDEFCVGFEYEYKFRNEEWRNYVYDATQVLKSNYHFDDHGCALEAIEDDILNTYIRVKYLDKEDIESLGWSLDIKPMDNDTWLWLPDDLYYGINKEHCNFLLSYNIKDNHCIIRIDNYSTSKWDVQIFNGSIKNKHELKILMKQLGI